MSKHESSKTVAKHVARNVTYVLLVVIGCAGVAVPAAAASSKHPTCR